MAVVVKQDIIKLCNKLNMQLVHFAMGTYPTGMNATAMPVNRLFFALKNPNGSNNFLEDVNEKIIIEEGFTYFCPAFHKAIFKLDDELLFVSIQFKFELFQGVDVFSKLHTIFVKNNLKLTQKAKEIFINKQDKLLVASEIKNLVFNFAVSLLNQMDKDAIQLVSTFAVYQDVINFITEHCYAGVTVDDLAGVMNMRREVFSRQFFADTGFSPKKFFNNFLLDKASKLLQEPHVTVREVSAELKFSSEYYFSRFFKRHTGVPPRQFQKIGSFIKTSGKNE